MDYASLYTKDRNKLEEQSTLSGKQLVTNFVFALGSMFFTQNTCMIQTYKQ